MALYDEIDPTQIKRKAQISALTGTPPQMGAGQPPLPTSNTMPVGQPPRAITPVTTQPPLGGAPRPSGARARSGSAPAGFDQRNWDDPNMQTVKYAAGSFFNGVTRPSEVAAIVNSPEFQARFPGARFNGKDMVDFAGALSEGDSGVPVGLVDVLRSADQGADSSEGFWWGANPEGGDLVTADGGRDTFQGGMGINPAGDSSALAQIMKELEAMRDGQQSPSQRDAIMQILGGAR